MEAYDNFTILLVEDDEGHARLIEKNLRRLNINNKLIKINDGREAINYMFRQGQFAGQGPLPPLIVLLDINLPSLSGYQILKTIKTDRRTKNVVVIVVTTTENPVEIERCYSLGCNAYVTKPVEYDQFVKTIRQLGGFMSMVKVA